MSLWLLAVASVTWALPRELDFTVVLHAKVTPTSRTVGVTFQGEDTDIVGHRERDTFELDERRLKSAVAAYTGRRPERAFVRSPTPWGDLYVSYGWEQVARTVHARRAVAHVLDSETVLVLNETYKAAGVRPTDARARVSVIVEDSIVHAWNSKRFFDMRREVRYRLRLEGAESAHAVELAYTRPFGMNETRVQRVKMEATFSARWRAPPQRGVVMQLWARRTRVRVLCEYEAQLRGRVAVNFATRYKNHYFWGIPIDELFKKNGIENLFEGTEILEVCFYSDFKVTAVDAASGSALVHD